METADVMFLLGLVCVFVGLGLEIGWGWALAICGTVLLGVGLWSVAPRPQPKDGK